MKAKWILAGLGVIVIGSYVCYDYAQNPTIRFIGYRPDPRDPNSRGIPTFEIRNDTRHPFTFCEAGRTLRIYADSGMIIERPEEDSDSYSLRFHTILPGNTFEIPALLRESPPPKKFALGIGFYRGTSEELWATLTLLDEFSYRWFHSGKFDKKRILWSEIAELKP